MERIKTTEIPRIKSISKEDFITHYFKPQKPVIIEDLAKSWPAYNTWSLDYIQSKAGDQIVPLYNNEPTKGRTNSVVPAKKMKLYDYIELLKTQPTDLRMFFYNVLQKMPELTKDFSYPDMGLKFFKKLPVMFFGGKGSKVLAHYDMDLADLVHFHFHGTKNVTLFAPDQAQYLYKVPYTVHNLECIDMDNPDFEKYPMLKQAHGLHAEMNHGDALYMPSGYWHYITYENGGFSITLRAFPRTVKGLAKLFKNLVFMRTFENIMRRIQGQKWVDNKEANTIKRVNKRYEKEFKNQ
ncbi:cupin-like domain-containing protein [Aurantibacter aestuarii]|uniref:Cupin n=1 Tax=Aurantibacter aestuarii TaxID=1266046 RepID=A0A2T1NER4_9FLAO|nr:cupin-like domain-containing protein [Aurantibacter aestuarii]PSG90927.1 cupin [Aurantibacter aestuarii]